MKPNRTAQLSLACFAVIVLLGSIAGCGGDGEEFREFSQSDTAFDGNDEIVAGGEGLDNTSADEAPSVVEPNPKTGSPGTAQMSLVSELPVAAPLPESADVENLKSLPNGGEPFAVVRPTEVVRTIGPPLSASGNGSTTPKPVVPREVKILVKDRQFKTEGPQKALRVTYDDINLLKVMNMEPVTADAPKLMPGWLKGLDGRRIRIRGFMYPSFQETGIPFFLLARDNQICCFGGEAKIYDLFQVKMRTGVTTDYIQSRPFDVVGVFHIDLIVDDGELFQLYRIDDAIIVEK